MSKQTRSYGTWPSPIGAAQMAGALRLHDVQWMGDTLVWLEGRGGQGVLVAQQGADAPRDLTSDLNVRARVGYGGGDFTAAQNAVYFVASGRLYRQSLDGGGAKALTPAFGQAASPVLSPDGRWLAYVHSYEGDDCLAVVDSSGAHWPQKLLTGHDFVMQPVWHPDGQRLACIAWQHPQMPWDGTELHLLDLDTSGSLPRVTADTVLAGDSETSIFQPEFSPDGRTLSYASDESGWWQLYLHDLDSGSVRQITTVPAEHGLPAWVQGLRSYAWGVDGLYFLRYESGFVSLWHDDLSGSGAVRVQGLDNYTALSQITVEPVSGQIALIASASQQPPRILRYRPASGVQVVRRATSENWLPEQLAEAEALSWRGHDGQTVHGLYYPPTSSSFEGSGLPPLIVNVHGGPTSEVKADFNSEAQFFTSRGFAVLEVNYRGSTGFGRAYRNMLRGEWGLYDVEDSASGAQYLVDQGRVDGDRLVIMGGSAGGFTVYQSLVDKPGFYKAAICRYGVSDQFALAMETHKFEARYTDTLLGPLPEAADHYRARSPIFHADQLVDPIAIYQGSDDRVVPQNQSDRIVDSLVARGITHEYTVYAGEGHGWRLPNTIEQYYRSAYQFLLKNVIYA